MKRLLVFGQTLSYCTLPVMLPTENWIVSGISKYGVFCFGDTHANEY